MRPCASHEASPEPTAMATEKMARKAVTTSSSPPSTVFTKRRKERQHHRADEPEPAQDNAAPPQAGIAPEMP